MAAPRRKQKQAAEKNPLWFHRERNRWCKRIKGRFVNFSKLLEASLKQYGDEKAQWKAGVNPREDTGDLGDDPTVADCCNAYRINIRDERLQAVTDHVRAWLLLRVSEHRRSWIIIGDLQEHYWTGAKWSTKDEDTRQFSTEKVAHAYLAERRAQLIAVPFEEDVEDKARHPDILPRSRQPAG